MTVAYLPPVQTDCVVDLSHNNAIALPNTAFSTAAASGVELFILKATQGAGMIDTTFPARRAAVTACGALLGAYHFCDGSAPNAQVGNFLNAVGDTTGVLLALDAEANPASQVNVYSVCVMAWQIFQQVGRWPLLYMGRNGPDNKGTGLNDTDVTAYLAQCDLWLPEYGNYPIPPPGFSKWVMHQYTGDGIGGAGVVAGIGNKLDRSYFAGTAADLKVWHAQVTGGTNAVGR